MSDDEKKDRSIINIRDLNDLSIRDAYLVSL